MKKVWSFNSLCSRSVIQYSAAEILKHGRKNRQSYKVWQYLKLSSLKGCCSGNLGIDLRNLRSKQSRGKKGSQKGRSEHWHTFVWHPRVSHIAVSKRGYTLFQEIKLLRKTKESQAFFSFHFWVTKSHSNCSLSYCSTITKSHVLHHFSHS